MELICTKAAPNWFTGNPVIFEWCITPYSQTFADQNPYVILSILADLGDGQITIAQKKVFPDSSGKFSIDIAPIADAYLKWFVPPYNLDQPMLATDHRNSFFVQPRVFIGTEQLPYTGTPDKGDSMIKGGLSYEYTAPVELYYPTFLRRSRSPLGFYNTPERVFKEDVFFYYYLTSENNTVTHYAKYVLKYLLGETEAEVTGDVHTDLPHSTQKAVCLIPIGYNQLNLDAALPAGAIPISYTITIYADGDPSDDYIVIAPTTFEIDHRKFYNTTQLLYRNSLGGLHPLRLIGLTDFEAEYRGDKGERVAPPSYLKDGNLVAQQSIPWAEEQPKFSGNTGFLDKFEADRMRDLFLSREVFEVKDGRFLPIVIDKKNVKFFANNDSLINIQIDWQHAFINNAWSKKILPDSGCPAMISLAWRQSGNDQITVFFQLPFGYDFAKVVIKFIEDDSEQEFFLEGNSGSQKIDFDRPVWATDDTDIIVSARVVCNRHNETPSYGANMELEAETIAVEFSVVALDDKMALPKGYSSPVVLSLNALLNDYDPDGGPIEAIVDTGSTNDGGSYEIDAAGVVTYTPPSSSYSGTDYFTYQVRKVGGSVTTTATYRIWVF